MPSHFFLASYSSAISPCGAMPRQMQNTHVHTSPRGESLKQVQEDLHPSLLSYSSPSAVRWMIDFPFNYPCRGGSRISLRGVLLKECVHEIFKATPTFQKPHRFVCVFNGCFSYRSKNYAKVSEIKIKSWWLLFMLGKDFIVRSHDCFVLERHK